MKQIILNKKVNTIFDTVGFSASMLCAIHCAVVPFVLSILPLLGMEFLSNPVTETSMVGGSFIIASCSLFMGYCRHKNYKAFAFMTAGFFLIGLGVFMKNEYAEIILSASGACLVATSHLINFRLCKKCKADGSQNCCEQ